MGKVFKRDNAFINGIEAKKMIIDITCISYFLFQYVFRSGAAQSSAVFYNLTQTRRLLCRRKYLG